MQKSRGFTLIEIMIAVLIAAILAVMAFSAMRQALDNRTLIQTRSARLLAVQGALRNLVQDLSQMQPRPMRDPLGDSHLAALIGATAASPEITFTRGGWSNYAGMPRSTLQRVRYALRDGVLYRDYWLVLDPQLDPLPMSRKLLDGVKDFQVRYMDDSRNWQQSWPPTSVAGSAAERELRWRPIAVEISLTLNDWGTITRLIEVAG